MGRRLVVEYLCAQGSSNAHRMTVPNTTLLLGVLAAGCGALGGVAKEIPFLLGADVSALPVFEQHGISYKRDGKAGDALALFRQAGMNCFRLRLFVNPNHEGVVTNDLDYTLALAKRVKASGAALMLDLHYSDTWADPGKQFKPAAWAQLPFDQLVRQVGDYTRDVLVRFAREGVTPEYIQIGNEITNGLLWPDGRVEFADGDGDPGPWERLARLLRAGIDAVPAGPGQPKVILQIENPGKRDKCLWFFRHAQRAGLRFDIIGVSYYPDWHGGIAGLRDTLDVLAAEFQRPVIVAEAAYPWKDDEQWTTRPNMDWPKTPEGQRRFLGEVIAAVRSVPGGLGRGVLYWHPEAVLTPGLSVWAGGSCALFDDQGEMLPGADFGRTSR